MAGRYRGNNRDESYIRFADLISDAAFSELLACHSLLRKLSVPDEAGWISIGSPALVQRLNRSGRNRVTVLGHKLTIRGYILRNKQGSLTRFQIIFSTEMAGTQSGQDPRKGSLSTGKTGLAWAASGEDELLTERNR
jgi:hypothetical protein